MIIKRNALVNFTQRQMFELVNNVRDYPRFLPWCRESHILNESESHMEATLEIAWSGIHKTFTTRNDLYPYERIEMNLISGPFKHLAGRWEFTGLGEQGCKVNFELEFELAGHLLDKIFESIFSHIANSLVDAFCRRATVVYGSH